MLHVAEGNAITVDLIIGDSGAAYVFCDNLFDKSLSWFEYDEQKSSLEFVLEDGENRNFGIPVAADIKTDLLNQTRITFVLKTGEEISEYADYPLIVHRAS